MIIKASDRLQSACNSLSMWLFEIITADRRRWGWGWSSKCFVYKSNAHLFMKYLPKYILLIYGHSWFPHLWRWKEVIYQMQAFEVACDLGNKLTIVEWNFEAHLHSINWNHPLFIHFIPLVCLQSALTWNNTPAMSKPSRCKHLYSCPLHLISLSLHSCKNLKSVSHNKEPDIIHPIVEYCGLTMSSGNWRFPHCLFHLYNALLR